MNLVGDYVSYCSLACTLYEYIDNKYKFTVVYCESVNLIGYITVDYLLIVNSYTSVHIAHHV